MANDKTADDKAKEAADKAKLDVEKEAADTADRAKAEGLVKVKKDGEIKHVHPTTLHAHRDAGWHLA